MKRGRVEGFVIRKFEGKVKKRLRREGRVRRKLGCLNIYERSRVEWLSFFYIEKVLDFFVDFFRI